jgi:omega-6 fatty acid desaturase (delta-12 desaturase)
MRNLGALSVRTEKELLIATKQFAAESKLRSWLELFVTLGLLVATLLLAVSEHYWFVRLGSSLVAGLLIVRLFIFYHDFQHGAILSGSVVASFLMDTYGLLVLSPPSVWNRSHDHHHKHNSKDLLSSMGSFPTMNTAQYQSANTMDRTAYYWSRHPLTIAFGYLTIFMAGMCIRAIHQNCRLHKDAILALVLHVAIAAALGYWGIDKLLLGMTLPLVVACGVGSYLFYAQHNFPGCHLEAREDWTHAGAALKSSSYLKMSGLMNWFTGNIGYHHIHHLNAKIPFYRLPEAMAALPELQKPASITLGVRDIVACFRSNVWDVDAKKLVSFRQAKPC